MLNETYTVGAGGTVLVFTKQYPDRNAAKFSVVGLTPNASRTLSVSHQPSSSGRTRTLVSFDETDVNPSSVAGATEVSRLYLVIDRAGFKSDAAVQEMRTRLKTLVDDAAFFTKLLNQEV